MDRSVPIDGNLEMHVEVKPNLSNQNETGLNNQNRPVHDDSLSSRLCDLPPVLSKNSDISRNGESDQHLFENSLDWDFELDEGIFGAEAFSEENGSIKKSDVENVFDSDSLSTNDEIESGYSGSVCNWNLVQQLDNISEFSCYSEEFNCGLVADIRNSFPELPLNEKV